MPCNSSTTPEGTMITTGAPSLTPEAPKPTPGAPIPTVQSSDEKENPQHEPKSNSNDKPKDGAPALSKED